MPAPRPIDQSAEPQSLGEIREWHGGVVDALVAQRAAVLTDIRVGLPASPRFVGMTEDEVQVYFERQRRELDRLTVLNLVASAEATIRMDFFRRVTGKHKDKLSVAYRDLFKKLRGTKRDRPDFDEGGILGRLKQAGVMDNHVVGRFRECLPARHWVSHGRFWAKPAVVDVFDPDDVYTRAGALLQALPD